LARLVLNLVVLDELHIGLQRYIIRVVRRFTHWNQLHGGLFLFCLNKPYLCLPFEPECKGVS
jgi:hypothetical protein